VSYILEALRKADHERQLARQRPADLARPAPPPRRSRRLWPWVAAAAVAINAAAGLIVIFRMPGGAMSTVESRAPGESPAHEASRLTETSQAPQAAPVPEVPRPAAVSRPAPIAAPSGNTRPEDGRRSTVVAPDSQATAPASAAPSDRSIHTSPVPSRRTPEARAQDQDPAARTEQPAGAARATPSLEADRPTGDVIRQSPRPADPDTARPTSRSAGESALASATAPHPGTAVPETAAVPSRAPIAASRSQSPAPSSPGAAPADSSQFRLDVHVYSERPGDRMVFINNRKYVEGQRVDAAHTIEEITPEGAVLSSGGQRIFLGR
jgi:general secretion pathway protein B